MSMPGTTDTNERGLEDHAIGLKAEIMVDHFHEQVLALNKIGGQARAMVVTSGIESLEWKSSKVQWHDILGS